MLFFLNAIFVFIQSLISFGWKVASDTKALIEFAVCSSKVHIVIAEGDRREMPVPLNRDIGVKEVVEGTKKGVNLEYGIEEGSKTILVVCVIGKLLTVRSCDLWHHEMQERGIFWIIEVCGLSRGSRRIELQFCKFSVTSAIASWKKYWISSPMTKWPSIIAKTL